ncbi:unnamed protein product [Rhodiola kirilowii]
MNHDSLLHDLKAIQLVTVSTYLLKELSPFMLNDKKERTKASITRGAESDGQRNSPQKKAGAILLKRVSFFTLFATLFRFLSPLSAAPLVALAGFSLYEFTLSGLQNA